MVGLIFGWLGLLFVGMLVGFLFIFVVLVFFIFINSIGINFVV